MKKVFLSLAIISAAALLVISCRKNDTIQNQADKYDNFLATIKSQPQIFTVNGAAGGTITGKDGTVVTFPANWAANMDGTSFAGDAIVGLTESLKKARWIADGLTATTKNDILESGGMLDINVTRKDNGAELKPATAMTIPSPSLVGVIRAQVPRNPQITKDLSLFLPDSASGTTLPPVAWTAPGNFTSINGPNSYTIQIPKFRWVNYDVLWNLGATKTTIRVTPLLTALPGTSNLQLLLVYRNISSVITLPAKTGFFESYANTIPVGSTADIVCLGKSDKGQILFTVITANTFTALQNISITPKVATAAEVKLYLDSL